MNVKHIVFNFNSFPRQGEEGMMTEDEIDIEETIKTAKQLSKFIR
jgi:hypothetical protein